MRCGKSSAMLFLTKLRRRPRSERRVRDAVGAGLFHVAALRRARRPGHQAGLQKVGDALPRAKPF